MRLTTRQIRNLEAEGLPCRAVGNSKFYPMPAAFHWWVDRDRRRLKEELEPTDYSAALARKMVAEARMAEIKVAEIEGALIPLAVHQEVLGRTLDRVRARIRNLPGAWAERLVGVDDPRRMVLKLREVVREVLSELSINAEQVVMNARQEEIPSDFPESATLRRAGVEIFAELLDADDITDIPGIGPAKAERIRKRLEELGLLTTAAT